MQLPLLERIEPTLGAEEDSYRRHSFVTDKAHAAGSALIVVALIAVVFAFELTVLPRELMPSVAAVRVVFFAIAAGVIVGGRRMTTPAALDRASLIFSIAFVVQFIVLLALRPPARIDEIAMFTLILGCYALSPARLVYRMVAPVVMIAGCTAVLWLVRGVSPPMVWVTVIMLVAVNALGLWGSARVHVHRRRQHQAQERLRASLQERDALIERLRQSHKMESMGRIVGGVAHDFNNILSTMLASVEFLIADLPTGSQQSADAEMLRASVKRGADLTRQLLAFSRQQVLEPKIVNLNDLVSDTQRMLTRTLGEHVTVTVSLGNHLSAVRVDPGQAQQMLLNLSVNARDAMPSGGTLTIQTHNAVLTAPTAMAHSTAPAGDYVVVSVSDTGTGMDASTLAQSFEPFFTTKPKGQGTGLGLSTVFGIVEQSGGYIRVTSAPGRGTTFDVFLPASAAPPAAAVATAGASMPRGTETILLAEDDHTLRSLLQRVFTKYGYRVLPASDGVDALRVAAAHDGNIELLASDVVMPSMGGPRLAQELSAKRPGIKVLFMSGYTEDAFADGKPGPGDAFLQKPVDLAVLMRKVRDLLDAA